MQKYKKDFVCLTFSRVFFATACIADFHISFASQCSSKYIGVREIRHTGKVASRFAHSCPSLWASLPNYVGHLYPRLWARLPKTLGIRTHVVCSARALSNGCKSRVSPNSGNYIAKGKGVHRELESERSRRQTSDLTNRNFIQGI